MTKPKVAYVIGSASLLGAGVATGAAAFARSLSATGQWDIRVFTPEDSRTLEDREMWGNVAVSAYRRSLPFSYAPCVGICQGLIEYVPDIIHVHGLWLYPMYSGWRYSSRHHTPTIISPQGMLDDWALAQSSWKKKLIGLLFQRRQLMRATVLHALSATEVENFRQYGLEVDVAVVPNGVPFPGRRDRELSAVSAKKKSLGFSKTMLYFGRLHEKKGVAELISGWILASRQSGASDWGLAIVGWGSATFDAHLRAMIKTADVQSIVLFGPLFDEEKERVMAGCDAFILPSYSEGLPVAVLEAWSHSKPVLMTKYCNISDGFRTGAALEIEPDPQSIAAGLTRFFSESDAVRTSIGREGAELVASQYTETIVGEKMADVYRWMLDRTRARPECITGTFR